MISLGNDDNGFYLKDKTSCLKNKHVNQLEFWGFKRKANGCWHLSNPDRIEIVERLANYLDAQELVFEVNELLADEFERLAFAKAELATALECGAHVKNGDLDSLSSTDEFLRFIHERIPRQLKSHQVRAALHMLLVGNAANFSVPGAGKTSVVLAVFSWLKKQGVVDSLFVVGPPSCFRPWRDEYVSVLGEEPAVETLAGGNLEERLLKYYTPKEETADLYLTTFHTLQRDIEKARFLFRRKDVSFYLVIDEAHYIKQLGGSWAQSVLDIAPLATRKCVLTGTPFPHSYLDAINIFDALFPSVSPLSDADKIELQTLVKKRRRDDAAELLKRKISPLFYRVRKSDLNLANQVFLDPIQINMKETERLLYDTILDRIKTKSKSDFYRDLPTAQRLQRGRMIRLRQVVSNAALLRTAIEEYDEDLLEDDHALSSKVYKYSEIETPAKVETVIELLSNLRESGKKAVVWSNFIGTLELIKHSCSKLGWSAEIICGYTPKEANYDKDVLTREKIIEQFKLIDGGLDILIANPAACAESVSLHKTCSHAIYYDLSYNCAQYLQSLDRIHRVGGSESKESFYYFLQYQDTFEGDILENLLRKARDMALIIDQDFPIYDFELDDGDLASYEKLFGN